MHPSTKIAISGASGKVGRQLVPMIVKAGFVPLLIGRDTSRLQAEFPGCPVASYAELPTAVSGIAEFVHLATINSDSRQSAEVFEDINVRFALDTCRACREAGVARFVYVSSTHALDHANLSEYARSKRRGAQMILAESGIDTRVLYLPAVIDDAPAGKSSGLNYLPVFLRSHALQALFALKPTVAPSQFLPLFISPEAFWGDDRIAIISRNQSENTFYRWAKRLMDIGFSLAVLGLLWWLLAVVWLAVRLNSPGPGFFRQVRVGKDEKPFVCYKFRTMSISTPHLATHQVSASAVTRVGAFLRRTKLDELPQAVNILANQMSLVGPRPSLSSQDEVIRARRTRGVQVLLPGITGISQIRDIDMSNPEALAQSDEDYLHTRSVLADIRIVWRTVVGAGRGDRVNSSVEPVS